jgi:3-oxo-5-alpha-steroid 4-dehydrogenase 1
MTEADFFHYLVWVWFGLAGAIFIALFFITAPYGRYGSRRWGFTFQARTGWIVMESASPVIFAVCFALGTERISIPGGIFLGLWEAHYIHRAYIYPLHIRDSGRPMPAAVVSLGFFFNGINSYLNGRYIFTLSGGYPIGWLGDPRFILGATLFVVGFIINRESDLILRSLRRPGESGYHVTRRGLFRWISCPNYLGEIMIWSGWALATWSLAGLSFAVWTAANLVPRARAHHLWYRNHFIDYPPERKILVPFIW